MKVEVRVPDEDLSDGFTISEIADFTWITIPTTNVESYTAKGDTFSIKRATKVHFPTVWGNDRADLAHNSPRRLIERYTRGDSDTHVVARVSYKNAEGSYVYTHFGWIGGVGQAAKDGVSKFWIHDYAEMLQGVPISTTINASMTVRGAFQHITDLTNANMPIVLAGSTLMEPETEEELTTVAQEAEITTLVSDARTATTPYFSHSDGEFRETALSSPGFDTFVIDTGVRIPYTQLGIKQFRSNKDTLLDVYEWFEKKTTAKISFEPAADGSGVVLTGDVVPTRRTFMQDEVIETRAEEGAEDIEFERHGQIDVWDNTALYEMIPITTVVVRGEVSRSSRSPEEAAGVPDEYAIGFDSSEPMSEKYPVATAKVPALVQAAGGVELVKEVEADVTTLDEAEAVAQRTLIDELSSIPDHGHMEIEGYPYIMPYDRLVAFESCEDIAEINEDAVEYEVEEIKHMKEGGGVYKSRMRVSLYVDEDDIETSSTVTTIKQPA